MHAQVQLREMHGRIAAALVKSLISIEVTLRRRDVSHAGGLKLLSLPLCSFLVPRIVIQLSCVTPLA